MIFLLTVAMSTFVAVLLPILLACCSKEKKKKQAGKNPIPATSKISVTIEENSKASASAKTPADKVLDKTASKSKLTSVAAKTQSDKLKSSVNVSPSKSSKGKSPPRSTSKTQPSGKSPQPDTILSEKTCSTQRSYLQTSKEVSSMRQTMDSIPVTDYQVRDKVRAGKTVASRNPNYDTFQASDLSDLSDMDTASIMTGASSGTAKEDKAHSRGKKATKATSEGKIQAKTTVATKSA